MVGDQLVFSDSEGKFQAWFRNQKEVKVHVVPSELIAPGKWDCVRCPESTTPGHDVEIVMRRAQ